MVPVPLLDQLSVVGQVQFLSAGYERNGGSAVRWPEKLSGTDAEVVQWRRLVVTKHFGGRDAEFEYRSPEVESDEPVMENIG